MAGNSPKRTTPAVKPGNHFFTRIRAIGHESGATVVAVPGNDCLTPAGVMHPATSRADQTFGGLCEGVVTRLFEPDAAGQRLIAIFEPLVEDRGLKLVLRKSGKAKTTGRLAGPKPAAHNRVGDFIGDGGAGGFRPGALLTQRSTTLDLSAEEIFRGDVLGFLQRTNRVQDSAMERPSWAHENQLRMDCLKGRKGD